MTRAEYLEYVQESMGFDTDAKDGAGYAYAPEMTLRDTPEVCAQLAEAHKMYCELVEYILFPDRATLDSRCLATLMDSRLINSGPRAQLPEPSLDRGSAG